MKGWCREVVLVSSWANGISYNTVYFLNIEEDLTSPDRSESSSSPFLSCEPSHLLQPGSDRHSCMGWALEPGLTCKIHAIITGAHSVMMVQLINLGGWEF